MFTSSSSSLDWASILSLKNELEEENFNSGDNTDIIKHDGNKSFNLSVNDFKKETIIEAIKIHHPHTIESEIYFWEHGNYFTTDKGFIYSMKNYLSPDAIKSYLEGIKEIDLKDTRECIKVRQKHILKKSLLEHGYQKMIYLRVGNERHLKLHLKKDALSHIQKLGYNIYREESYFERYNIKTNRFEEYDVFFTRINRDVFLTWCSTGTDISKGYNIKDGKKRLIKRGRPARKIRVEVKGKAKVYSSIQVISQRYKVPLSTLKRKFTDVKSGDEVIIKRGVKMKFLEFID